MHVNKIKKLIFAHLFIMLMIIIMRELAGLFRMQKSKVVYSVWVGAN